MTLVQNFPFAAIMLCLAGGVACTALKPRAAMALALGLTAAVAAMTAAAAVSCVRAGESYRYLMGHFPAPWGNEIRIGPLEALIAAGFTIVMILILAGGRSHILEDTEPDKVQLYCGVACLLMSSLLALVFTNDIFTAYVFVEINTLASCALVMIRYRSGMALAATVRYLIMSLLGSGLFLIGIIILYHITGHLLMEPMGEKIRELAASGNYMFPLTVTIGFFTVGLALKSALWPFSAWLPDAHASATSASSGILSGLVIKGYIVLLIKLYYRVFGMELVRESGVLNALLVLGIGAMTVGSLYAMREKDVKRMLAYSSVAQVGYIFAGIGIGTEAGIAAACVQILVHAVTKPMLFISAGALISASGGSRQFSSLRGAGRRDPLSGLAFAAGAFSMIGIPLFAGFATKYTLCTAAVGIAGWKGIAILAAVVVSTVLNALYYLPALQILFDRSPAGAGEKRKRDIPYTIAVAAFLALHFVLGLRFSGIAEMIISGIRALC